MKFLQKEMFIIVLASNSNTAESDWRKIVSGDNSVWTQNERQEIVAYLAKHKPIDDKWQMLTKAIKLRMNEENANHFENILNKMRDGATLIQFSDGMVCFFFCSDQEQKETANVFFVIIESLNCFRVT